MFPFNFLNKIHINILVKNNPLIKNEITLKLRKYFELNTNIKISDVARAVLKEKSTSSSAYNNKEEKSLNKNLRLHFKKLI